MGALQVQLVGDEPRVRDIEVGEACDLARPRRIRDIIKSNQEMVERLGTLPSKTAKSAGRDAIEFWLNEAQACYIVTQLNTPKAKDATVKIINVFVAWRRGELVPKSSVSVEVLGNLFDQKLEPVHREMTKLGNNVIVLADRVGQVEKSQEHLTCRLDDIVPRRDFSQNSHRQFDFVTFRFFSGKCCVCQDIRIVNDEIRRIPKLSHAHHMNGRERNSPSDGLLVCEQCHYRIERDSQFAKKAKDIHVVFEMRRHQTFGNKNTASSRAVSGRRSKRTIHQKGQLDLFGRKTK